jgi:hypothetical protein
MKLKNQQETCTKGGYSKIQIYYIWLGGFDCGVEHSDLGNSLHRAEKTIPPVLVIIS